MLRAVAPGGYLQAPALRQMLTGRADPGVDQRVANGLRDWIEAPLLRRLIWMVDVKLVDEFIERHRKISDVIPTDACDLGKVLRAGHIECYLSLRRSCLDRESKVPHPQLGCR
jgi:hypothetical protein